MWVLTLVTTLYASVFMGIDINHILGTVSMTAGVVIGAYMTKSFKENKEMHKNDLIEDYCLEKEYEQVTGMEDN
jgi:uncharacterized protein YneF (UPF0154 family)